MLRAIVGFHADEAGDWVAELDCGHGQHVRHRPPWSMRPWTLQAAERNARMGTDLDCRRCERRELPDCLRVRRTAELTETSMPAALRMPGTTPPGVWTVIRVESGVLECRLAAPFQLLERPAAGERCVVPPGVEHYLMPVEPVRLLIELWETPKDDASPR